jgi:hypothetical protein
MVSLSQESIDEFRARTALETALGQLDSSWLILVDLRINGPTDATAADYVALHPRRGIALIDVILSRTGDPAQRLRDFLDGERFPARFPGTLPIVRLVLRPTEATMFGRRVHGAFAAAPPITIADAGWVAAVNDLLVPADPSAPRPVLPLLRRSGLGAAGAARQKSREQARQAEKPAARPDETWAVTPDRWPDKVAAATPLKRSGKPAPDSQPSNTAPSPPAPPPPEASAPPRARAPEKAAAPIVHPEPDHRPTEKSDGTTRQAAISTAASEEPPAPPQARAPEPAPTPIVHPEPKHRPTEKSDGTTRQAAISAAAPEEPPAPPRARAPEPAPAPIVHSEPEHRPTEKSDRTTRRAAESEETPPQPDRSETPRRGAPKPHEKPSAARQAVPVDEEPILDLETSRAAEPTDPSHDVPLYDEPDRLAHDKLADERQGGGGVDNAYSSSLIGPIARLVRRQRGRAWVPPRPPSAPPRRMAEEDIAVEPVEPPYRRGHDALDSGLTAQRGEDFLDLPAGASWRGHAAAAIVLVALLGGGIAWLSSGDSANKLVARLPGASSTTTLPITPPAADLNPADSAPPPAQSEASPQPSESASARMPEAETKATPPAPPAAAPAPPAPLAAAPVPPAAAPALPAVAPATPAPKPAPPAVAVAPAPPVAAPATPAPAESSVASLPVMPPLPKPKPAPPPAAAPSEVAKATEQQPARPAPPPVATETPAPAPAAPVPKSNPPRELAEKPAPPAPRAKSQRTAKTERPDNQAPAAASPPRARPAAPREPGDLGPPIDLADLPDLPPGETAAPSSSPAPLERRQSPTPTLASTSAARMHGPTSLLPPSLNAPASAQQAGSSEVCRSYTSMKTLLGQQRQVSGLACRDTNGQWQIITELPD